MHTSIPKNALPRWRGFNLLEMLSAVDSSQNIDSGRRNPPFQETDFQWIADWGFDFVRLPMSYHCWSSPERWLEMDEAVLAQVDAAVELGRRYDTRTGMDTCWTNDC